MFSQSLFQPKSGQFASYQKIWQLAWPMILANISVPLLGFVDTAVIGHLPDPSFLAGTALASLLITVSFWLCGFLRMSTTGLIAQALGRADPKQVSRIFAQGIGLAMALACLFLILQGPLFSLLPFFTSNTSELDTVLVHARTYFDIRIWAAPMTLVSLVLTGYLIAKGQTKRVLIAVIGCNLINLFADIILVPVLDFGVAGLASASLLAEASQLLILLSFNRSEFKSLTWRWQWLTQGLTRLFQLNFVLFCRSALLQLCLSFMTLYASRYGQTAIAVNAILMQFFLFISFSMDGIAFALESLVGKRFGAGQLRPTLVLIRRGLELALTLALVYTLVYGLTFEIIISALTSIDKLQLALSDYLWCALLLPIMTFASFIYDGVFIGLGWVRQMRNSMALAAAVFFVVVLIAQLWGNMGLWFAFLCFMLSRGISQHVYLKGLVEK